MQETHEESVVGGALDHLVNQFSDPLSFLRELIQNSIDAGTREIDVWLEHSPDEQGNGPMIIHVDDFGEGMDRHVIDDRLTRLFASSKDGDLTKIGRFGIGFASVFAIKPEAVCVDTSKGGESWRVLFNADRSFSRIERELPVEGTKIQVIKDVDQPTFLEYRRRAHQVIRYWCKHVEAEIRFEGELLSGPLELDAPFTVSASQQGTTVIAGFTPDGSSFQGFYNKGLTLRESAQSNYPGVAFKVSSRYLEHTLTRDNVLRDENYEKAMRIVDRLVHRELIETLFERLDRLVSESPAPDDELAWHQGIVATLLDREVPLPPSTANRAVFRSPRGEGLTLERARRAARDERILLAEESSPLTEALREAGFIILSPLFDQARLRSRISDHEPDAAQERFCLPLLVDDPDRQWSTLIGATRALLDAIGAKVSDLRLGHWSYAGGEAARWPALTQSKAGELTPLDEARQLGLSLLSRKRALVLNADHASLWALSELAGREPELAAYTLTKLFFLGEKLDLKLDLLLTRQSLERRCRRQTS